VGWVKGRYFLGRWEGWGREEKLAGITALPVARAGRPVPIFIGIIHLQALGSRPVSTANTNAGFSFKMAYRG